MLHVCHWIRLCFLSSPPCFVKTLEMLMTNSFLTTLLEQTDSNRNSECRWASILRIFSSQREVPLLHRDYHPWVIVAAIILRIKYVSPELTSPHQAGINN